MCISWQAWQEPRFEPRLKEEAIHCSTIVYGVTKGGAVIACDTVLSCYVIVRLASSNIKKHGIECVNTNFT